MAGLAGAGRIEPWPEVDASGLAGAGAIVVNATVQKKEKQIINKRKMERN
jgi:hypothetical protein